MVGNDPAGRKLARLACNGSQLVAVIIRSQQNSFGELPLTLGVMDNRLLKCINKAAVNMSTVKVIYNREVTLFIITVINGHILCDITDKEVSECDIVHSGIVHIYYALGSNFHAALKYFQHIELSSHHIALAGGKRCASGDTSFQISESIILEK